MRDKCLVDCSQGWSRVRGIRGSHDNKSRRWRDGNKCDADKIGRCFYSFPSKVFDFSWVARIPCAAFRVVNPLNFVVRALNAAVQLR
jgi:hypothetical protein